jgi:hypothetical protein
LWPHRALSNGEGSKKFLYFLSLSFGEDLGEAIEAKPEIPYICRMTKEQIQDLRDRVTSLRRHL